MVKYEWMRQQIIHALEGLSDTEYQQKVWIGGVTPSGGDPDNFHDDFDLAINILFDDTQLNDNPESAIGILLRNEAEVQSIKPLIQAIDDLLKKLGTDKADLDYISDPDWPSIVEYAQQALAVFISEE